MYSILIEVNPGTFQYLKVEGTTFAGNAAETRAAYLDALDTYRKNQLRVVHNTTLEIDMTITDVTE